MRSLSFIFSLALFSAAFLSFSIQPVLGKMLLPLVGGSPAGWIVAMAFFQTALLMGYGVSYVLGRFNPWCHALGLLAMYAAGYLFLPAQLPADFNEANITIGVITALSKTIFVPFLALTATTAALQRVFAATTHPTAKDPYYLFVASNIGSFAGLLIYPFFLEPHTGLQWQAQHWQIIYIVTTIIILSACALAWFNRRKDAQLIETKTKAQSVTMKQIFYWMALAFVPCSLSMGVTTLVTTDLGGWPLFWVLPLGLYLLTFILAFARKPLVSIKQLNFMHLIAAFFMVTGLGFGHGFQPSGNIILFLFLATLLLGIFFLIAWACHRNLAQSRPEASQLTLYYFIIALGGALAGLTHTFIIPFVLHDVIEFPIMVVLSLVFLFKAKDKKFPKLFIAFFLVSLLTLALATFVKINKYDETYSNILYFVFFIATLIIALSPRLLLIVGIAALIASLNTHYMGDIQTKGRNFFGQYAVYDIDVEGTKMRLLMHGSTLHGTQAVTNQTGPIQSNYSYYSQGNPIQDILTITHAKTLGVIGLGAGQMACYNSKLTVDFYEIDQAMVDVANNYFTYLKNCPVRNIIVGDGRKMLVKSDRLYDVIMIDAFTSDTIPLHLVTTEAIEGYRKHLTPNGILLFHISNRFLKLAPPLAASAKEDHLIAYDILHYPKTKNRLIFASQWVAVPLGRQNQQALLKMHWRDIKPAKEIWTDDQSSLLSAVSIKTIY